MRTPLPCQPEHPESGEHEAQRQRCELGCPTHADGDAHDEAPGKCRSLREHECRHERDSQRKCKQLIGKGLSAEGDLQGMVGEEQPCHDATEAVGQQAGRDESEDNDDCADHCIGAASGFEGGLAGGVARHLVPDGRI